MCGCLAAAMLAVCIPVATVLADSSSDMTIGGNKEVGSTITATVYVSGDGPYAGFAGSFSYDSKCFELQSITPGNYGSAHFSSDGVNFVEYEANIGNGASIVVATFKSIAAGTGSIACNIESLGTMNGIESAVSSPSVSVTITTPVAKSSDATLASLSISPGTLSPAFSGSKTSYTATVDAAQSKITVSAKATDSKAKVSLNGVQDKLVSGDNTVKITVTAENGATNVYTIKVTRAVGPTPTPGPTPAPLPLMNYGGTDYTILTAGDGDNIPAGFSAATVKYKNIDIPALELTYGSTPDAVSISIIYLTADSKTGYFVYDTATETCYPYVTISPSPDAFQILGKSDLITVPAGYEAFDYSYQDENITAYRLISDLKNPQILLYLIDGAGVSGFYYYDTINAMILPYRGEVLIAEPTLAPTSTPTSNPTLTAAAIPVIAVTTGRTGGAPSLLSSLTDFSNPAVLIMYFFAVGFIVLAVICIVQFMKARKREYEYGDIYDDAPYGDQPDPITDEQTYSHFYTLNRPKGKFGRNNRGNNEDSEVDYLDIPDITKNKAASDMDAEDPDYDPNDFSRKKASVASVTAPSAAPVPKPTAPAAAAPQRPAVAPVLRPAAPTATVAQTTPVAPLGNSEPQRPAAAPVQRPAIQTAPVAPAGTAEPQRPAAVPVQRPAIPTAPAEQPRPAAVPVQRPAIPTAPAEPPRPAAVPVSRPAAQSAPAEPQRPAPAEPQRPAPAPVPRSGVPSDIVYRAVPKQTGAAQMSFGGIEPGPKTQDTAERTLDFPKINTAKREDHIPVRLQRDLEMEKAKRDDEAMHSRNNMNGQNPPAKQKNNERMPRGTRAPNLGFLVNDPDIDPDDR